VKRKLKLLIVTLGFSLSVLGTNSLVIGQNEGRTSSFVEKMIAQAQPRMVKIFGAGAGRVEGFATGFFVSKDGRIVTAQGVILDGRRVRVVTANGTSYEAAIIRRDRQKQVAVLKIEAETPDYFELSEKQTGE